MSDPMYNRAGLDWLVDAQQSNGARWARDEIKRLELDLSECMGEVTAMRLAILGATIVLDAIRDIAGREFSPSIYDCDYEDFIDKYDEVIQIARDAVSAINNTKGTT